MEKKQESQGSSERKTPVHKPDPRSQSDPHGPSPGPRGNVFATDSSVYPVMHQPGPMHPQPYPPPYYGGGPPQQQQSTNNTTVVINQANQYKQPRTWSSGLCQCGKDCDICCCGLFCSPCLSCQVSQDMGESCCVPYCVPSWLIVLRSIMRERENIHGSVLDDCCTIYCCGTCVLCQLAYEVRVVKQRQIRNA